MWRYDDRLHAVQTVWYESDELSETVLLDIAKRRKKFLDITGGKGFSYIYIFGDWNAFKDPRVDINSIQKIKDRGDNIVGYVGSSKLITALSANTSYGWIVTAANKFNMIGGLKHEAEWQALLELHEDVIAETVDANEADGITRESMVEELSEITGRMPFMVKEILKDYGKPMSWTFK